MEGNIEGDPTQIDRICVTHVINPHNFWARLGTDGVFADFDEFEHLIQTHCGYIKERASLDSMAPGDMVFAQNIEGKWLRAKVNQVLDDGADVMMVDYWFAECVAPENIIPNMVEKVEAWPNQAWKCRLHGVKPLAPTWIKRATDFFTDHVLDKVLAVTMVAVDDDNIVAVDIHIKVDGKDTTVNELMMAEALAMQEDSSDEVFSRSIPEFNIEILSQAVARRQDSNDSRTEESIEEKIFKQGIPMRSDSFQAYEYSDYSKSPVLRQSEFGSIRDQLAVMKGANDTQSDDEQEDTSRARKTDQHKVKVKHGRGQAARRPDTSHSQDLSRSWDSTSKLQEPLSGSQESMSRSQESMSRSQESMSRSRDRKSHRDSRPLSGSGSEGRRSSGSSPWRQRKDSGPLTIATESARSDASPSSPGRVSSGHVTPLKQQVTVSAVSPTVPPPGGRKSHGPRRRKNQIQATMKEKAQNEILWQEEVLRNNIKKLMRCHKADEDVKLLITKVREKVAHAEKLLAELGVSDSEVLGVFLEVMCDLAVLQEEGPYTVDRIIDVIQGFIGSANFLNATSEVLWKNYNAHVKNGVQAAPRDMYCVFLANFYIRAQSWAHRHNIESVTVCIINIVGKWTEIMNGPLGHDDLETYVSCVCVFLGVAGAAYKHFLPTEHAAVLDTLRDILYGTQAVRSIKQRLFRLIHDQENLHQEVAAPSPVLVAPPVKKLSVRHVVCQTPPQRAVLVNQISQTDRISYTDRVVQVNLMPSTMELVESPSTMERVESPEVMTFDPDDDFVKVKVMLRAIKHEELLDVFEEHAISDQLLDIEFAEMKELLKECRVKAGYILLIKRYLKDSKKREELEAKTALARNHRTAQKLSHQSTNGAPIINSHHSLGVTTVNNNYHTKRDLFTPSDFQSTCDVANSPLTSKPQYYTEYKSNGDTGSEPLPSYLASHQNNGKQAGDNQGNYLGNSQSYNHMQYSDHQIEDSSVRHLNAEQYPGDYEKRYYGDYPTDKPEYYAGDFRGYDQKYMASGYSQHGAQTRLDSSHERPTNDDQDFWSHDKSHMSEPTNRNAANFSHGESPNPIHPRDKYDFKKISKKMTDLIKAEPELEERQSPVVEYETYKNPALNMLSNDNHDHSQELDEQERQAWVSPPSSDDLTPHPLTIPPPTISLNSETSHQIAAPDPDEFPPLGSDPEPDQKSPPTPRSYVPPPPGSKPILLEKYSLSEETQGSRGNIAPFGEAVDMSQSEGQPGPFSHKLVRMTDIVKSSKFGQSQFGKNRRCTGCGAADHIVDDCTRKSHLFIN